jgi:chromate reductase
MSNTINILGFAGSLRKDSFNKSLLNAAVEQAPDGMNIEKFDIKDIPLFNQDVEALGIPDPVKIFRNKIQAADGLLIITPEYNYSIPGVLKNAIDWASRPPNPPLNGKPLAIMGATMSMGGTMKAQMHLRQVCVNTNTIPMNKPEILVSSAQNKFDASGKLTDDATRGQISKMLVSYKSWVERFK